MSNSSNTTVELFKIVTKFLSENSTIVAILLLCFIFRDSISNLITRLTSFRYKKGDSEFGVEAVAPSDNKKEGKDLQSAMENPIPEYEEGSEIEDKAKEENWFADMNLAFDEGRINDAEEIFNKHSKDEGDEEKYEENKALYLYLRFEKGKDNSSIEALENLAHTAKTEESKFNILIWLSFCLRDTMQYRKEVELWESTIKETQDEVLVTRAIINLSHVLIKEKDANKARKLLIDRLSIVDTDEQKVSIYSALSKVELELGNKKISVYCKDKSLEYDPNNRDELFNSAYDAGDEDIDEISISNYLKLIRIDNDNSTAINNLGVRAQEAGLTTKAIENYKKSSELENTLAMANQGYMLLEAGFTEEAENIAKKALEMESTHKNIYNLMSAINNKNVQQDSEWKKLTEKSLSRQKMLRVYLTQYYLGKNKELEGDWVVSEKIKININITKNSFSTIWQETPNLLSGKNYSVELKGEVSGSTFSGSYTRKVIEDRPPVTLLGAIGNSYIPCLGYITNGGDKLNLISSELKTDFSISLLREK